jgi:hypothetical protein
MDMFCDLHSMSSRIIPVKTINTYNNHGIYRGKAQESAMGSIKLKIWSVLIKQNYRNREVMK